MYQRNSRPVRRIQLEQAVSDHPELFVYLMQMYFVENFGHKPEDPTSTPLIDPFFKRTLRKSALDRRLGKMSLEDLENFLFAEPAFGAPVEPEISWRELLQEAS